MDLLHKDGNAGCSLFPLSLSYDSKAPQVNSGLLQPFLNLSIQSRPPAAPAEYAIKGAEGHTLPAMTETTIYTLPVLRGQKPGIGAQGAAAMRSKGALSPPCGSVVPSSQFLVQEPWVSGALPLALLRNSSSFPFPPLPFPETQANFLLTFQAAKFNFTSQC